MISKTNKKQNKNQFKNLNLSHHKGKLEINMLKLLRKLVYKLSKSMINKQGNQNSNYINIINNDKINWDKNNYKEYVGLSKKN